MTSGKCGARNSFWSSRQLRHPPFSSPGTRRRRSRSGFFLVHSFGSAAPPFTVQSTAFETELVEKMGDRVDLDEVSLDMARYADRDMQEAIVDYLQKRQAKWQPDLVVPIGSPAAIFVANYRDRLFPETPILYATLDRQITSAGRVGEERGLHRPGILIFPASLKTCCKLHLRQKISRS